MIMSKRSPISIFLAASALLATSSIIPEIVNAGDSDIGGLKEWTTDQAVNEESKLDEAAKKKKKQAEEEDLCIPVGEGENCW